MPTSSPLSPEATARSLVTPGKGLLAADESFPTIAKRFEALGIDSTEETRAAYRELLFTTPGLNSAISGVILFDETLRQKNRAGVRLATLLEQQGIIPGIKVDAGTIDFPNFPGEKLTQGLDGLRERLAEYRELGARFTKWRAVLAVDAERPTRACLDTHALHLALFASLSQEAGLVPIVEPEILMDGAHTIERCEDVTNITLKTVFGALIAHRVRLSAILLKPAMVLPGKASGQRCTDEDIAERTVRCLRRGVPETVPGIVFLSGGQTPAEATRRLAAIHRLGTSSWALSFSYGRALQEPALNAWKGKAENVAAAQAALIDIARQNSLAVQSHA